MKKTLYGAVLLMFVISMVGCSLEETPESLIPESEAYATPTMIYVNTVANLYVNLYNNYTVGDDNFQYVEDKSSDILWYPGRGGDWVDGGKHQNAFLHNYDPSSEYVKSLWNTCYTEISLCNTAISKLDDIVSMGTVSEDTIDGYKAEVRAIRAFYYMWLCNFYGRVPIVTSPEISVNDVAQSERSEVLKFVLDEIVDIVSDLPNQFACSLDSEYYGRFTKGAVYAMLAKVAINAGVFSKDQWNDGTFTGGYDGKATDNVTDLGKKVQIEVDGRTMNAWETVIYCKETLESLGYILNTASWNNIFKNGNEGNKENIFVHPYDDNSYRFSDSQLYATMHYNHAATLGFGSWNGVCATKQNMEIFGVKEDLGTYPDTDKVHSDPNSEITITCDDPRFDLTYYNGNLSLKGVDVESGVSAEIWPKGAYLGSTVKLNFETKTAWEAYIEKWSGYRMKKYEYDPSTSSASTFNADRPIFRMGDMYLLAAEAYYRMGDTGKALGLVNEVRQRAGAPAFGAITMKDIIDERARELMWETVGRRSDLIRVGQFTEPTVDKYVGVSHAQQASDFVYDATGKTIVLPIPASVMSLNPQLTQNSGY